MEFHLWAPLNGEGKLYLILFSGNSCYVIKEVKGGAHTTHISAAVCACERVDYILNSYKTCVLINAVETLSLSCCANLNMYIKFKEHVVELNIDSGLTSLHTNVTVSCTH